MTDKRGELASLAGKTVLFVGSSRGVGRVAAIEMARRGAEVLIVGHDKARGADALAALRAVGRGEFFLVDMGEADSVRQLALRVCSPARADCTCSSSTLAAFHPWLGTRPRCQCELRAQLPRALAAHALA